MAEETDGAGPVYGSGMTSLLLPHRRNAADDSSHHCGCAQTIVAHCSSFTKRFPHESDPPTTIACSSFGNQFANAKNPPRTHFAHHQKSFVLFYLFATHGSRCHASRRLCGVASVHQRWISLRRYQQAQHLQLGCGCG